MTYDRNEVRRSIADAILDMHLDGPQAPTPAGEPVSIEALDDDTVDKMTAMLGLPPEVGEMAKNIIKNGQPCERCGKVIKGEGLDRMFAFTASTPRMSTPSPATIICEPCGYLTAAFMGIKAAKQRCREMGWSA